ncbi:MAG: hypothetical protein V4726_07170 [Verrucomicrobiota bacterium]
MSIAARTVLNLALHAVMLAAVTGFGPRWGMNFLYFFTITILIDALVRSFVEASGKPALPKPKVLYPPWWPKLTSLAILCGCIFHGWWWLAAAWAVIVAAEMEPKKEGGSL